MLQPHQCPVSHTNSCNFGGVSDTNAGKSEQKADCIQVIFFRDTIPTVALQSPKTVAVSSVMTSYLNFLEREIPLERDIPVTFRRYDYDHQGGLQIVPEFDRTPIGELPNPFGPEVLYVFVEENDVEENDQDDDVDDVDVDDDDNDDDNDVDDNDVDDDDVDDDNNNDDNNDDDDDVDITALVAALAATAIAPGGAFAVAGASGDGASGDGACGDSALAAALTAAALAPDTDVAGASGDGACGDFDGDGDAGGSDSSDNSDSGRQQSLAIPQPIQRKGIQNKGGHDCYIIAR